MNLYAELVETKDGKEVGALYGTPCLDVVAQADDNRWRGLMESSSGALFGVVGASFVSVYGNYQISDPVLGTLGTDLGPVSMQHSQNQILIVDGTYAYGYDIPTNRFRRIELPFDTSFPIISAYQDGLFVINQAGTQRWWQSDVNDVFTWNALNFSSKDSQPDPIVAILSNHREIWLFGSDTTEVWVNQGNQGFVFQRLEGVFFQYGCAAPFSAQVASESIIWLAESMDGRGSVMMAKGFQAQRISTHAIEREIQSYARVNDAIAYTYQQEGHVFYVLTFPSADATWCYDLSTGLWHERAWFDNGSFHRHRSNCCATFNGKIVVGDFENGFLYEMRLDVFEDAGHTRKWLRSFPAQPPGQIQLTLDSHWRGQLYMEPGVGRLDCGRPIRVLASSDDDWRSLASADTDIRVLSGVYDANCQDPQVMLRYSDDGALSWKNEQWRSAGRIGETRHRVVWTNLGSSRDRIYEISATDPFKPALLAFFVDIEPGLH